jgi:hypothetical protein
MALHPMSGAKKPHIKTPVVGHKVKPLEKTPSSVESTIEAIEDRSGAPSTCTAPNIFFMGKVSVELPQNFPTVPLEIEKARQNNEYPAGSIATYHCSEKHTFTRTCKLSADKASTSWVGATGTSCDGESCYVHHVITLYLIVAFTSAVPLQNVPVTLKFDLLSGKGSSLYNMDDIIKFQSALSTASGIPESHISLINVKQLSGQTIQLDFLFRLAVTDSTKVQTEVHSSSFSHAIEDALDKKGVEIAHLRASGGASIYHGNTLYVVAFLCLTAFLLVKDPCSAQENECYCIICGQSYISVTGTTDRCPDCSYTMSLGMSPPGSPQRPGSPLSSFNQPGSTIYAAPFQHIESMTLGPGPPPPLSPGGSGYNGPPPLSPGGGYYGGGSGYNGSPPLSPESPPPPGAAGYNELS